MKLSPAGAFAEGAVRGAEWLAGKTRLLRLQGDLSAIAVDSICYEPHRLWHSTGNPFSQRRQPRRGDPAPTGRVADHQRHRFSGCLWDHCGNPHADPPGVAACHRPGDRNRCRKGAGAGGLHSQLYPGSCRPRRRSRVRAWRKCAADCQSRSTTSQVRKGSTVTSAPSRKLSHAR